MKTKIFSGMVVMLMALVGMTACDNEGNPMDNPMEVEIDPALLEQTTPEFTSSDFRDDLFVWTTSTNGTWVIHKLNGIVSDINYGWEPSPEPPHSAEDFFMENLPLTADDEMRNDGVYGSYRHYYKGVPVERGLWGILFNGNVIYSAAGHFSVINNLDVVPLISEDNAKKIVESYIKDSVVGEDKCFYLSIMEFPGETTLEPRLVYVYKYDPGLYHNYVYVDAKTGRLLYQITCSGDKPYY